MQGSLAKQLKHKNTISSCLRISIFRILWCWYPKVYIYTTNPTQRHDKIQSTIHSIYLCCYQLGVHVRFLKYSFYITLFGLLILNQTEWQVQRYKFTFRSCFSLKIAWYTVTLITPNIGFYGNPRVLTSLWCNTKIRDRGTCNTKQLRKMLFLYRKNAQEKNAEFKIVPVEKWIQMRLIWGRERESWDK